MAKKTRKQYKKRTKAERIRESLRPLTVAQLQDNLKVRATIKAALPRVAVVSSEISTNRQAVLKEKGGTVTQDTTLTKLLAVKKLADQVGGFSALKDLVGTLEKVRQ